MNMADLGWVWEGQGLDPGVCPSIFGLGEGAAFFGLRKAVFLFHPTTELALDKLSALDSVVCDVSKWGFADTEGGGSCSVNVAATPDDVYAEARHVSGMSNRYPNIAGALYDDVQGLMARRGDPAQHLACVREALREHNRRLELWAVVYSHELGWSMWPELAPHVDIVHFWIWNHNDIWEIERHVNRCREVFPEKPIVMGCYLRDYHHRIPMPMEALRVQWELLPAALEDRRLQGFAILGTVLIDGQVEQARWVREFIRAHAAGKG